MERGVRVEGWESRLTEQLRMAGSKGFDVREWNCCRFAHRCVEAISGQVLPYGRWKGSLQESVDALLPRVEPRRALRGDVVLACVPEPSLGVCLGHVAAFVGQSGLMTLPMRRVVAAWSV